MDYIRIFDISASGMQVQKTRLEVAAQNLANAQTSYPVDGSPVHGLRVFSLPVQKSTLSPNFESSMDEPNIVGSSAVITRDTTTIPRLINEPGHPHADANGMVRYPGIDHLEQMTTITQALRIYEANVAAFNAAKTMASRALEIGGNS